VSQSAGAEPAGSASGRLMYSFELFGQHVQIGVSDTKGLQLFHPRQHVIAASTRPAVTLASVVQLLCKA